MIPDRDRPGFPFMGGTRRRQIRVSFQGGGIPHTNGSGFPFREGDTRHRQVKVSLRGGGDTRHTVDRSGFPFREGEYHHTRHRLTRVSL
jgi:hypothetical protein